MFKVFLNVLVALWTWPQLEAWFCNKMSTDLTLWITAEWNLNSYTKLWNRLSYKRWFQWEILKYRVPSISGRLPVSDLSLVSPGPGSLEAHSAPAWPPRQATCSSLWAAGCILLFIKGSGFLSSEVLHPPTT